MKKNAVTNHRATLKRVWTYVKQNYGNRFGPEGGRLIAFMHANNGGGAGGTINFHFDKTSDCRNLIDLNGGSNAWSRPLTGFEFDIFLHEISHIVEGTGKRLHHISFGGTVSGQRFSCMTSMPDLATHKREIEFTGSLLNKQTTFRNPGLTGLGIGFIQFGRTMAV